MTKQIELPAPGGWLYDWTNSSALGKPNEEFTSFTTDAAHAKGERNARAVYTEEQVRAAIAKHEQARVVGEPVAYTQGQRETAYDLLDRKLRNTLDDANYAEMSGALECVFAAPPAPQVAPAGNTVTVLPDGSAFGVMSFPLPADHWLYRERVYMPGGGEPVELPSPVTTHADRDRVVAAVRYAIRGATMCGQEMDFDPDALVQNAVYALCGPYTRAAVEPAAPVAQPATENEAQESLLESFGKMLLSPEAEQAEAPIDYRKCEFCHCNTNAKMRRCCINGAAADALASKPTEPVAPPARGRDFHAAKAAWLAEPEWNNSLQSYDRGWYDCSVLSATTPAPAGQDSGVEWDQKDHERLDWLMHNLSGKELRRIGIETSSGGPLWTRVAIDAAIRAARGDEVNQK